MNNEIKGTVATVGNISGTLNAASGYDGASAYELALKNGFEGTEAEWIESLQGKSGVYLGSGEMPADCNVQIDPNGEADFSIDDIKTENGTVVSGNADFAEVAEWADGNPGNEDRTGYFVCANVPVDGIVMRKATSTDDVKGVSILAPAFAGNYTKDKLDSNGNLLPKYSYVAIIGFVPVRDNGTCSVGGRCMPDDNGCAIPSSNNMGYQVVNRIDENRVLIIIEPNGDMVQRVKTKITELKEEIKRNSIHNSASGESILLTDSSNYAIEGLKVYGKSTQDGTPTPEAPIPIVSAGASGSVEVKVCGRNLFNANKKYSAYDGTTAEILDNGKVIKCTSGLAAWAQCDNGEINLIAGVKYTVSIDNITSTGNSTMEIRENNQAIRQLTNTAKQFTFVAKNAKYRLKFIVNCSGNNLTEPVIATYEGVRIVAGDTALPFEPYTEQTLTLATPNELNEVGSYKDYIDLEKGVRVQNCKKVNLGDCNFSDHGDYFYFEGTYLASVNFPDGVKRLGDCDGNFTKLTHLQNKSNILNSADVQYNTGQGGGAMQNLHIRVPATCATNKAEIKAWCAENNVQFLYALAEPIETPLTAEEIAYYKALHTNYPNTTIFNSDGTNMDVSYIADTKLYIDNKFAELQALALEG